MSRRTMQAASVGEGSRRLLAARGVDCVFANSGADVPSIVEADAAPDAGALPRPCGSANPAAAGANARPIASAFPDATALALAVICNAGRRALPSLSRR